jgi:hypothetical protein
MPHCVAELRALPPLCSDSSIQTSPSHNGHENIFHEENQCMQALLRLWATGPGTHSFRSSSQIFEARSVLRAQVNPSGSHRVLLVQYHTGGRLLQQQQQQQQQQQHQQRRQNEQQQQ